MQIDASSCAPNKISLIDGNKRQTEKHAYACSIHEPTHVLKIIH